MRKKDTIQKVAEVTGNPVSAVKFVYETMVDLMQRELQGGEAVYIKGLGKIEPIVRAPRKGRNASTGEILYIPAKRGIRFVPAGEILKTLNSD